jgi:hypothetical protein
MMMRHQNVGQGPASVLQSLFHGSRLGRVDRGGGTGLGIVDQNPEIIGEAWELMDFRRHVGSVLWD